MAKNNQPQATEKQKVQTKYDRKMEERRKREEKDKREAKVMRIGAIVLCFGIVAAIAASITISVLSKNSVMKDTYVTVGEHTLTKLEYDYYYNTNVNNYLATYSSFLAYMGLDMEKDLDEQQYSEDMTWKDMFDQMTVEQVQQTKALADDAAANGFTYDDAEEYANLLSSLTSEAETAGVSVSEFYKKTYGNYASEKNMEPLIKESLLTSAYYKDLITKNVPTEQEVKDYYAKHVQEYDKVDYRSFAFTADVAEDAEEADIDKAMMDVKNKAEAMMKARQGGEDFKALCLENAGEEEKATYEDAETDASFSEGSYYAGAPAAISGWLYEDGRAEGDITIIEDTANNRYYVVEFVSRYYDEADDESISSTMASDRTAEYVSTLAENYTVTDNKGELKYLTIDTSTDTAGETTDEAEAAGNSETTGTEAEESTAAETAE